MLQNKDNESLYRCTKLEFEIKWSCLGVIFLAKADQNIINVWKYCLIFVTKCYLESLKTFALKLEGHSPIKQDF